MSAAPETNFVRSSVAARKLGVRTRTLAKWRQRGAGPKGWVRLSPTMTLYPEWGLAEFMTKRASESFEFNFRRKSAPGNASELA